MGTTLPRIETLGWGDWCGAGTPYSCSGTAAAEISLPIFNLHMCMWDQFFLLAVSTCLLLYVLSYKTYIQQDYKQFSMMVALKFSCNLDMVTGGGEHSV